MTLTEEVLGFAREYINKRATRTPERKRKIREVLRLLTGENLVPSCGTCYIEALYKILKFTKMATSNYELKRGVVLQAFGDPTKTCTNDTITDALGDWYMTNYPEKAVYFVRCPQKQDSIIPQSIKIIPPANIVLSEKIIIPKINAETNLIESVTEKPKITGNKTPRKPGKTKR